LEFSYRNLFIYSSVVSASAGASASFFYFSSGTSASFSDPLSERPSIIAPVTKDKILSIDLEASSLAGIT
jgi:hypothetical protein